MFLLCFGHWNVQKHEHDVKKSRLSGPNPAMDESNEWATSIHFGGALTLVEKIVFTLPSLSYREILWEEDGKDPTRSMLQHASTSTFCGSEIIFSFLSIAQHLTILVGGWWNVMFPHKMFSDLCVCLYQGGRVLFEKQLIHTVAVPSLVFVERCHEMSTLGLKFFNGGDDNPERDPWDSTDTGQRRGSKLNVWKIHWNLKIYSNTQYMNVHDILPIDNEIWLYTVPRFVPFLTIESWKVKVWHYDTLCFFCFEESLIMVRNEWHPLVRGTFKQISQVALKMQPWSRLVSTRLWLWTALAEFFIVPRIWFLEGNGEVVGRLGWKLFGWCDMSPLNHHSPDFSLNLSPFVLVPHGGTRQFWWLLLPKKSFLERSALAKKDSAELVAFHQVDGFFMFFCSIFLLYFDESFQGLTGLL